jgi:hypothetical protein
MSGSNKPQEQEAAKNQAKENASKKPQANKQEDQTKVRSMMLERFTGIN